MQIYIDDSGNIVNGLRREASESVPYFVLAAVVSRENLSIERCIKNIRRTIRKKERETSELKFNNCTGPTRRRILQCIGRTDNDIVYALLSNSKIQHEVEPRLIYNDICKQLVYTIVNHYGASGQVDVIIDKSLYGAQRAKFDACMADKTGMEVPINMGEIKVSHVDSQACPFIQAVDFVAGAINRKYRDNDDLYFQMIQNRIATILNYEP